MLLARVTAAHFKLQDNGFRMKDALKNWDGKTVPVIIGVYDEFHSTNDFVDVLIECVGDADLQIGATWLLKHHLGEGGRLDNKQTLEILKASALLESWPGKLHLLQMLPQLKVPEEIKYELAHFVRAATDDENKFVRAWGYNGLYELANQFHEFREGLDVVFAAAMESEPASVKARLRNINQKIDKNWV